MGTSRNMNDLYSDTAFRPQAVCAPVVVWSEHINLRCCRSWPCTNLGISPPLEGRTTSTVDMSARHQEATGTESAKALG